MRKTKSRHNSTSDSYEARLVAAQTLQTGSRVRHKVTGKLGRCQELNLGFALPEVWVQFESDNEMLVPTSCSPLDIELVQEQFHESQVPEKTLADQQQPESAQVLIGNCEKVEPVGNSTYAEVLPPLMTEDEARQCIAAIKGHVVSIRALILDLEERRGWEALGYRSITACLISEFPSDSKTKLIRTLEAARIERHIQVVPIGTYPESQLRPLNKLAPKLWLPTLARAHQLACNGKLKATHVNQAVNEMLSPARFVKPPEASKYQAGSFVRVVCQVGALPEQKAWNGCWAVVQSTGNISCVRVLVGGFEVNYMAGDLDWEDHSDVRFRDTCERILALWQTELEPIEQTLLKELQRRHFFTDLEMQMISLMECKRR